MLSFSRELGGGGGGGSYDVDLLVINYIILYYIIFKHFHHYDIETISTTFQPRERVHRKHAFQLLERNAKDGSRGIQSNSFYYRPTRAWNNLPKTVVDPKSINSSKNRLDKHMSNDRVMFDHTINIERIEA